MVQKYPLCEALVRQYLYVAEFLRVLMYELICNRPMDARLSYPIHDLQLILYSSVAIAFNVGI